MAEKKILRLNMQAFDEAWHLQYAYTHLRENWSPAPWKKALMYFVIDWLSEAGTIVARTSGSTGKPKKLELQKKYMAQSAAMTLDFFGLQPGDKALLCLPIKYIAAKMMVVRAFTGKLDLYCIEPKLYPISPWTPEIDFAAMTPSQVQKLLDTGEGIAFLQRIKTLLLGGAAIPEILEKKLQHLPVSVWHSYGMTETMSHIALRKVNEPDAEKVFTPLPGITIEKNSNGCLRITAPQLGIFGLETHDVVEIYSGNRFKVLGRSDFVINSGGVKLFPEQIERKLSEWIAVPYFIGAAKDAVLGEKPVLYIESEPWPAEQITALEQKMREGLAKFEIPKEIRFVKTFQRTATGKVIRYFE